MCSNTQKKKAAGAGKDFTLFFGVMLHFNFKCVLKNFRYVCIETAFIYQAFLVSL